MTFFRTHLAECPIIAILRGLSPTAAEEATTRLWDMGVDLVEVTVQDAAGFDTLEAVAAMAEGAVPIAGGSDLVVSARHGATTLPADLVAIDRIQGLNEIRQVERETLIGAAASHADLMLNDLVVNEHTALADAAALVGSPATRNVGTIGGNIANGSPIGDSMPWLIAVGARVVLKSAAETRTLALEDLYLDYMQKDMRADEIVEAIEVPRPRQGQVFRTYKLAKRFDSDISAVCAAFSLILADGSITEARVALGGMAATPKRALLCEQAMVGKRWDEAAMLRAKAALGRDFQPLSDMRASADNRLQTAQNLLHRFYLETRADDPLPAASLNVFAARA